jgi:hypothetical protein
LYDDGLKFAFAYDNDVDDGNPYGIVMKFGNELGMANDDDDEIVGCDDE